MSDFSKDRYMAAHQKNHISSRLIDFAFDCTTDRTKIVPAWVHYRNEEASKLTLFFDGMKY